MSKLVFGFGSGNADGHAGIASLLGGKGANLAEMSSLGIPVPPGFTISTEVCRYFFENEFQYPSALGKSITKALSKIELETERQFGDPTNPLLVSVRSGSRFSMPGMMDTILNLGLNAETVAGLAATAGSERFAWDSYRRFIQNYSHVVFGLDNSLFDVLIDHKKRERSILFDGDLTAEDLKFIVEDFKNLLDERFNQAFPEDPNTQLYGAISAVFRSWKSPRALKYRHIHNIPEDWGTAVNVQAMVFGNISEKSATGVAFTRNPSNGQKTLYGEFLVNSQGEDVVSGARTPRALTRSGRAKRDSELASMEELMPAVFEELREVQERLELHFKDMQDIEFTVEEGRLWILQTRSGERSSEASIRIAVDMANEGLITREEAVTRVDPSVLNQFINPIVNPQCDHLLLGKGLPASPGAVSGAIIFDADEAVTLAEKGQDIILVRTETSPRDIHGIHAARGILTTTGGMTSHAAVVARGMGRPCVTGAADVFVDYKNQVLVAGQWEVKAGEPITIDGSDGQIYLGTAPTIHPIVSDHVTCLMSWAKSIQKS
ncbi:MAG: pyruvate, phosphate dikinase [Rhodospirillales bacterium]